MYTYIQIIKVQPKNLARKFAICTSNKINKKYIVWIILEIVATVLLPPVDLAWLYL